MNNKQIVKSIMECMAQDCGETYEGIKGYTNDDELPGMVWGALQSLDYWMWRCKAVESMVKVPSDDVLGFKANQLKEEWKVKTSEQRIQTLKLMEE